MFEITGFRIKSGMTEKQNPLSSSSRPLLRHPGEGRDLKRSRKDTKFNEAREVLKQKLRVTLRLKLLDSGSSPE